MSTEIDPGRLSKAVWLDVEPEGFERYLVTGGADDHLVVVDGGYVNCGCEDSQRVGDNCKHSLATRLICGDPVVAVALRTLVDEPARRRKVRAA